MAPASPAESHPLHGVLDAVPAHWSPGAMDVMLGVLEQRDDLAGAAYAILEQVAELITLADEVTEEARAASFAAVGSTGQPVLHPGVPAAVAARRAAGSLLQRLAPAPRATATDAKSRGRSQRGTLGNATRWQA